VNTAEATEGVGLPALPPYPLFSQVEIPGEVYLTRIDTGTPIKRVVKPTRAWRGPICPFEDDHAARLVARALAAERPVDVHGGYVLPPYEAHYLPSDPRELRMRSAPMVFEVMVLEFAHTPDPWVFSLSPVISRGFCLGHPHLRSDRELILDGRVLHGLCIYSAAEFSFDPLREKIPQFLDQVSIFLANHIVWSKTRALYSVVGSQPLHWIDDENLFLTMPADTPTQIRPSLRTLWKGYWPSPSAIFNKGHLNLDPNGPCWCGDGKLYKDCCRPWEYRFYQEQR